MDQRAVDAEEIRKIVQGIPAIGGVRMVRSRFAASGLLFAELTIVVDENSTVAEAHALADAVEARITEALGASDVTVHVEPP